MAVVVALLRGVNVGGHNRIPMKDLFALCESLGFASVQTYVQSGNVVFRTGTKPSDELADQIGSAIEGRFGFRPQVILRSFADFQRVVSRNPFASRQDIVPGKLLVMFLPRALGIPAKQAIARISSGAEELHVNGREIYIYFPEGMGRSKLPALLDKALSKSGTGRNWNTVTKLVKMAADCSGGL